MAPRPACQLPYGVRSLLSKCLVLYAINRWIEEYKSFHNTRLSSVLCCCWIDRAHWEMVSKSQSFTIDALLTNPWKSEKGTTNSHRGLTMETADFKEDALRSAKQELKAVISGKFRYFLALYSMLKVTVCMNCLEMTQTFSALKWFNFNFNMNSPILRVPLDVVEEIRGRSILRPL